MKTTVEIPDDLFRRAKAAAALRSESLKELLSEALEAHLDRVGAAPLALPGWRSVFGLAALDAVAEVDSVIAGELERVDPEEWR